jgi:hypothetical protein
VELESVATQVVPTLGLFRRPHPKHTTAFSLHELRSCRRLQCLRRSRWDGQCVVSSRPGPFKEGSQSRSPLFVSRGKLLPRVPCASLGSSGGPGFALPLFLVCSTGVARGRILDGGPRLQGSPRDMLRNCCQRLGHPDSVSVGSTGLAASSCSALAWALGP